MFENILFQVQTFKTDLDRTDRFSILNHSKFFPSVYLRTRCWCYVFGSTQAVSQHGCSGIVRWIHCRVQHCQVSPNSIIRFKILLISTHNVIQLYDKSSFTRLKSGQVRYKLHNRLIAYFNAFNGLKLNR